LQEVDSVLIGSVNLYVQGVEVHPRDIDILTTPTGAKKIEGILKEYQTKEMYFDKSEGRNSFRAFYKIDDIEIEVLGNIKNLYRTEDFLDKKIIINYKGIKLPCLLLEEELRVYKKMGRKDKVELDGYFKKIKGFDLTKALFSHLRRKLQIINYFQNKKLVFGYNNCLSNVDLLNSEKEKLRTLHQSYNSRKGLSKKEISDYHELAKKLTNNILTK